MELNRNLTVPGEQNMNWLSSLIDSDRNSGNKILHFSYVQLVIANYIVEVNKIEFKFMYDPQFNRRQITFEVA